MRTSNGLFVTGTDTGVGKTRITLGLITAFQELGRSTLGMKPVSAGCARTEEGLRNEDALLLQQAGSVRLPYAAVNPFAFEPAVSPHIAAAEAGVPIDFERVAAGYRDLASKADKVVVEGAGGWYAPLGEKLTVADLAKHLEAPVVLVVGIRLGCLNHALLTARAIAGDGLSLAGWVANLVDPAMEAAGENVDFLRRHIPAPMLGTVPYRPEASPSETAHLLDTGALS